MEPVLTLTYYAQLREQMLTDQPAGSGRASDCPGLNANPLIGRASSTGSLLGIDAEPVIVALQNEYKQDVNGAKIFPRLKHLARLATGLFEGPAGVFAVFYLLAIIALSGALLFFTFSR
jgi:hypothetical protein